MLKNIEMDRKPDGKIIKFPVKMTEANIEQQVKLVIEMADYNAYDAHMHLSVFRHFHSEAWTLRVLQLILQELQQPSIKVNISHPRGKLVPFFTSELEKHQTLTDEDYRYPPDDAWRLPM